MVVQCTMNRMLNLWVLLTLTVLIQGEKIEEEKFYLKFLQNDYQIKFERLELVRYNKDLVEDASIVTFKYNRTTAVANVTFTLKFDAGNDLVAVVQAYKFMSNEYRTYPIHFAGHACKAFASNAGGIRSAIRRCGNFTRCPMVKGIKYHSCNLYPDQSKFPPFIPDGQYKIEAQVLHSSIEVSVINVYLTVFRPIV